MSVVVQFNRYRNRRIAPPLVLVDMHQEQLDYEAGFSTRNVAPVLAKCRQLLERARSQKWPVAFVRPLPKVQWDYAGLAGQAVPRWIEGFEPLRTDMIFDRTASSCYTSAEFYGAMDQAGGEFVLAGFSADTTCLTTLTDAARVNHCAGLIEDATATRPLSGLSAADSHRAVLALAGRYATVMTARRWIEAANLSPSPLERNRVITFS